MKGRTYEELDLLFANKANTRAFKHTEVGTLTSEVRTQVADEYKV